MRRRLLVGVGLVALTLAVALATAPSYRTACYAPELRTGFSYTDCWAAANIAIGDIGRDADPDAVAIWVYRGCPPGAYCALVPQSDGISSDALSAIVSVRYPDGSAELRVVHDIGGWAFASKLVGFREPNALVDSIFATRGAMIGP